MPESPRTLPLRTRARLVGKPARLWALEQAKLYIGVKEHPAGSNRGPHIDRWCRWANGLTGYPWCSAFACGMFREAKGLVVPEPRYASVGFLEQWAEKVGELLKPGTKVRPGDLVIYRFDGDDWPDHVGIVDKVFEQRWRGEFFYGSLRTVEGNTSAEDDANGGEVEVRYRSNVRMKFVRLDRRKLEELP